MTNDSFEARIDRIEQRLDAVVEHGDDVELFIASYLHGHFSLVVSQCLTHTPPTMQLLNDKMHQSLDSAFDNQELPVEDQKKVYSLWEDLIHGGT